MLRGFSFCLELTRKPNGYWIMNVLFALVHFVVVCAVFITIILVFILLS